MTVRRPLTLDEEFLLIAHLDLLGRPASRMSGLDLGLSGAFLSEHALAQRIEVTQAGVVVRESENVQEVLDDPLLLRICNARRPRSVAWWLSSLQGTVRTSAFERLTSKGVLRRAPRRGVTIAPRFLVAQPNIVRDMRERLEAVAIGTRADLDGRSSVFLEILFACGLGADMVVRGSRPTANLQRLPRASCENAAVRTIVDQLRSSVELRCVSSW